MKKENEQGTECRTQGLPPEGPDWGTRVQIRIVKSPGFLNTQVVFFFFFKHSSFETAKATQPCAILRAGFPQHVGFSGQGKLIPGALHRNVGSVVPSLGK